VRLSAENRWLFRGCGRRHAEELRDEAGDARLRDLAEGAIGDSRARGEKCGVQFASV
jgi:hypothetical protein